MFLVTCFKNLTVGPQTFWACTNTLFDLNFFICWVLIDTLKLFNDFSVELGMIVTKQVVPIIVAYRSIYFPAVNTGAPKYVLRTGLVALLRVQQLPQNSGQLFFALLYPRAQLDY